MNRKANTSTKSEEVQPNAPAKRQITANFNTFDN